MPDDLAHHISTTQQAFFPMPLPGDLHATPVDIQTYFNVAARLDPLLFTERPAALAMPAERHDTKRPLYVQQQSAHQEAVAFMRDERFAVGYCAGRMTGALEFLLDRVGLLAEHRGQGVLAGFLRGYVAYLAAVGYERVVAYCTPSDQAAIISALKAGFSVAGFGTDDDGPHVKLLYLCHADRRAVFWAANNLPPAPE